MINVSTLLRPLRNRPRRALRLWAGVIALAVAVPLAAIAQEGPVPPRDLGAIDQQLHSLLQYAPPGAPQSFRAPSGARVDIRAFSPVERRSGRPCGNCGNPCRGYRIDYVTANQSERVVMEGYRCRRGDGLWVMVQPETIISRESAAPEPTWPENGDVPEMPEDELRRRGILPPTVTTDATDVTGGDSESGPVQLSPDGETETLQSVLDPNAVESAPLPDAQSADASPTQSEQPPSSQTAAAPNAPNQASEPTPQPTTADQRGPVRTATARPISETDTVSRVVYPGASSDGSAGEGGTGDRPATEAAMEPALADPAVAERLKELHYLPASTSPEDREAIRTAIGEFAVDEQFALPVDANALSTRLEAAAERNDQLSACDDASGVETVCEETQE
ncbi:hypothetical protein [Amorphus sp. 3PC139-8]|uniref:hypothetical protein n=1 Tax=Amorphus sp. 3PC139-8 TaxID=2735676 RepID=UPI00345D30F9